MSNGINKIRNGNSDLSIMEILSLSLIAGGDSILKFNGNELLAKIINSEKYSDFRNKNTILSNKESFIVGELFRFKIESTKPLTGYVLTNIELLVLSPTGELIGDSATDILVNMDDEALISIIKNSRYEEFVSEQIKAPNKEMLLSEIESRTRLEDTGFIFYIGNNAYITYSKDYDTKLIIIEKLNQFDSKVSRADCIKKIIDNLEEGG